MAQLNPRPMDISRWLCLLLAVGFFAGPVFGDIIEVEPGASIQAALRAAEDGTIIHLLPGVHRENLQITGSAYLLGDCEHPEDVVLEGLIGPVVMISGGSATDSVRFEGVTIRGGRGYLPDGILHTAASSLDCHGVVIEGCERNGLNALGPGLVVVNGCTFQDNGYLGIEATLSATLEGSGNTFENNGADLGGFADPALRTPLAVQTTSRVVYVPQQYATLQEAVDAAPEGGTVCLDSATHVGGVTVWKSVTILGQGVSETELHPEDQASVTLSLLSSAESVVLQSMMLRVEAMNPITAYGSLTLQDVLVSGEGGINNEPAIAIQGTGVLTVRDSVFATIGGIALQTTGESTAWIEGCRFEGNHKDLSVQGARRLDLLDCTFSGAREESVLVSDADFEIHRCDIGASLEGLTLVGACGDIRDCSIHDAANVGLYVFGSSDVLVCATQWSGGNLHHVFVADDASLALASCTLDGAPGAGLVAAGTSTFRVQSSSLTSNGGAGLIATGQSNGEVIGCSIEDNGLAPFLSTFEGELYSGGILVSVNAQLTVRNSMVSGNGGGGILLDSLDPLSDEALDLEAFTGRAFLPIADVVDCTIQENETVGISVRSYGRLTASNCIISGNTQGSGIVLDDTGWVASGTVGRTFHLRREQTNGVDATITGCTVRNHIGAGVQTVGSAWAQFVDCVLSENSIGILMDVRSWIELLGNAIVRNIGYGIWFDDDECESMVGMCPPEEDHLTGFDNVIPERTEADGNGVAPFSTGSYPCLTLPEGCAAKD